jgi:hypothetical protein
MLALAGAVTAVLAVGPASAGATTTVNPTSLDFGTVPVGQQSPTLPVTLTETCTSITCILPPFIPDTFSPVLSATSGFVPTSTCPTTLVAILPGLPESCTVDVSFVPVVGGPLSGLLSTGSGGPTVTLHGTASAPPSSSGVKRRTRKCKKKQNRAATTAKKKKCKARHR